MASNGAMHQLYQKVKHPLHVFDSYDQPII